MFDIDLKNVKKGKRIYYLFLVVGLLFLVVMGGIIIGGQIKLKKLDSEATTTRIDVNSYINDEGTTMYSPIYYFEVNGNEYKCTASVSSSSYPETGKKTVYYDSNNPENCMTEYSKNSNYILIIFLIIPISFILIATFAIKKVNNRVKEIKKLNMNGKLIKNLPYRLENSGTIINGVPIQKPVIDYKLPSGTIITLHGDPRNDGKKFDADGFVDLLIDETNPENYYIDFEINRLSGNLPQDYASTVNNIPTEPTIANTNSQVSNIVESNNVTNNVNQIDTDNSI